MRILYIVLGVFLISFGALDALWVDGNAGPMTRRHNSWMRRLISVSRAGITEH